MEYHFPKLWSVCCSAVPWVRSLHLMALTWMLITLIPCQKHIEPLLLSWVNVKTLTMRVEGSTAVGKPLAVVGYVSSNCIWNSSPTPMLAGMGWPMPILVLSLTLQNSKPFTISYKLSLGCIISWIAAGSSSREAALVGPCPDSQGHVWKNSFGCWGMCHTQI